MAYHKTQRGFSLVEMLIVAAVMLLFFGGLFGTVQVALDLIGKTRGTLTALTVANDYMEYIRSLSYDTVGTVAGIPAGPLPQVSTTTLNGITFTRRVLVEYIDSPGDGVGAADSNAITTDYKQAKVEVSWVQKGQPESIFLVTNIIPRSIETNVGGGTIRVNVTDADVLPLPGVQVQLINNTGTSTINVTRTTDATGVALFGGAPANANYEVIVSAPGYSTDGTRQATTSLPVPLRLPFAVEAAGISTQDFQIDRLGSVSLRALTNQVFAETIFALASSSEVATSTDVVITSDTARLSGSAPYPTSGIVFLNEITPTPLVSYDTVMVAASTTLVTDVRVRFYTSATSSALISESDLPGNAAGFAPGTIDLSALDSVLYATIVVGLELVSTDGTDTPVVHEVIVRTLAEEDPVVSVPITLTSEKVIGSESDTTPIPKHILIDSTDSDGLVTFSDVEWGGYRFAASGYDVREVCSGLPITVNPGAHTSVELLLAVNSAHSLRVFVTNDSGVVIPEATVELRNGSTQTRTTSDCGQAFFGGLATASDYDLEVSAPGYTTTTITPLDITGDVYQEVVLTP